MKKSSYFGIFIIHCISLEVGSFVVVASQLEKHIASRHTPDYHLLHFKSTSQIFTLPSWPHVAMDWLSSHTTLFNWLWEWAEVWILCFSGFSTLQTIKRRNKSLAEYSQISDTRRHIFSETLFHLFCTRVLSLHWLQSL